MTRAELLGLGFSDDAIRHRVRTGRLVRVHQGVYTVGGGTLSPHGHRLAAVAAYGPTALLSHQSAAGLWDLRNPGLYPMHITVPDVGLRGRKGLRVHRTSTLHPDDVATLHGIPVTSVARTHVDLAGSLRPQQLLQTVEQADRLRLLDLTAMRDAIERNPTRTGVGTLRSILKDFDHAPDTASALERRFLAFVDAHGLPRPLLNVYVEGLKVDAYWPAWDLVVELDSRAYHMSPRAFETDRMRDVTLRRAGHELIRITDKRLRDDRTGLLSDILALAKAHRATA